jgi:hemerythrin-like domain-containing protein
VKRHEALAQLSRDHHQALFQAQRLRRATEEDAAEVRAGFVDFFRNVGNLHFRAEEEVLLPAYAVYADPSDEVVIRVLVDHTLIRRDVDALDGAGLDRVHELGDRLEAHVRHEERVLFPLIEQALPDDELARVARRVDEVEHSG